MILFRSISVGLDADDADDDIFHVIQSLEDAKSADNNFDVENFNVNRNFL